MNTPSEPGHATSSGHNILVIDDEFGPRESLRFLFKDRHNIKCVDNVDEGVRCIETFRPDVIITDIKMPKKNGIDGLRDIRRVDPNVSVIMLTGFGDFDTATAALRLGANDYLTKPFNTVELSNLVDRHIQRTIATRAHANALKELEAMNATLTAEVKQHEQLSSLGAKSSEFIHDLSNPFSVICMCVQMLGKHLQSYDIQGDKNAQVLKEYARNINSSAQRCKDLFELWRKAEKEGELALKPCNLKALLQEVADRANVLASAKGATVRLPSEVPDCMVQADEVQLYRCFQNVVTNAVQALPSANGVVELFWQTTDNGMAEIHIKDNGCGIPPDKIDRIFDPHFTTKRESGGLGLGLFITHKLIELHHGTIVIANNPDHGATTTVRLPVHPAQPAILS